MLFTHVPTTQIKILGIFITLESFHLPLSVKLTTILTVITSSRLQLPINEVNVCLCVWFFHSAFCVWQSSTHAGVCFSSLFYCRVIFLLWIYNNLFIYSPINGHFDYFQFPVKNRAAINILIHFFWWTYHKRDLKILCDLNTPLLYVFHFQGHVLQCI